MEVLCSSAYVNLPVHFVFICVHVYSYIYVYMCVCVHLSVSTSSWSHPSFRCLIRFSKQDKTRETAKTLEKQKFGFGIKRGELTIKKTYCVHLIYTITCGLLSSQFLASLH